MQFEATMTPEVIRAGTKGFVRRQTGWSGVIASLISLPLGLYVIDSNGRTWIGWVLLGALTAYWLMLLSAYWLRSRHGVRQLLASGDGWAMYEVAREGLRIRSRKEGYLLPWDRVKGVWRFESCWLLFVSPFQYLILPIGEVSEAALEAILSHTPLPDRSVRK